MVGMWRVLLCVGVAVVAAETEGSSVVVETPLGSVKGEVRVAGPDRNFTAFTGIPYAKPPIGELRFKDPVPAEPWTGVRETFQPPKCPQVNFEALLKGQMAVDGEEDCLYLNVYTPKVNCSGLGVMVFIHGGAYVLGSPSNEGGSPLPLLKRDIVLVTIQYRLGTLGFLSTEDDVLPGNLGLKDQTEALRWVQANIRNFGGDPEKVTIFGESAGSASVHQQILSPTAKGLFQRAIMQSGNALAPWALRSDHRVMAGLVGQMLECPGVTEAQVVDSAALLKCLQEAPVEKLVPLTSPGETWNLTPMYMVPRVDGHFLPAHPAKLLRNGRFNMVDIISGICAHESISFVHAIINTPEGERLESNFTGLGPLSIGVDQEENAGYLTHRIYSHYLGSGYMNVTTTDPEDLIQMFSDMMFTVSHDEVSYYHAIGKLYGPSVYMYQLDHVPHLSVTKHLNWTVNENWVGHGEDLQFLFTNVLGVQPLEAEDDLVLSDIFVDLWTNFATHGNPTPDMSLGFKWVPATYDNLLQLSLTPAPTMKLNPRDKNRNFHRDLPTTTNKHLHSEKFTAKLHSTPGLCLA